MDFSIQKANALSHILMFDMDETIAPSGQPLSAEMCNTLDYLQNIKGYTIAFATARDYANLEKRIPQSILSEAYSFCCFGMEVVHNHTVIAEHLFTWPEGLKDLLQSLLESCEFPIKTGGHIIKRTSTGAFTPLGQNATPEQREAFIEWNKKSNFLMRACNVLNCCNYTPNLDFQVFGKTTIDFSNKKLSKASVLNQLREISDKSVVFFGDQMHENGNDFELAQALKAESTQNQTIPVKNPDETMAILKGLCAI
tara:strand:+ start:92712 stop:93473 length:762 start_codon:yes stop_codon:yes gene_type:complete